MYRRYRKEPIFELSFSQIGALAQSEFYDITLMMTGKTGAVYDENYGDNSHMQHTPNPSAHGPWDTPRWIRHSYVFMHIPWRRLSSDRHSSSTGTGKKFNTAQNELVKREEGTACSLRLYSIMSIFGDYFSVTV